MAVPAHPGFAGHPARQRPDHDRAAAGAGGPGGRARQPDDADRVRDRRAGIPSRGFAVHIPHYLVNTEYPTGAITVLEEISKAGDLVIDQGELPRLAAQVRSEIDDSIASSSENAEVVTALELQHDADVASWPNQLPSGDELMDQIEEFLAGRDEPE